MVLDLFVAASLGVLLVAVAATQSGPPPAPARQSTPRVLGATTAAAVVAYSIGGYGTLRGYALLAAIAVVALLATALRTSHATPTA